MSNAKGKWYWYVLIMIGCCLMCSLGYFVSSAPANYYTFICERHGFELVPLQLFATITTIGNVLGPIPLMSVVYPKIGYRKMVLIFGLLGGVCYLLLGFANQLWMFYVLGFIAGACGGAVFNGVTLVTVQRWFQECRNLMNSVLTLMTGIMGIIMAVVFTKVLPIDYTYGFVISGVIILVCSVVTPILTRTDPSDVGMKPLGYERAAAKAAAAGTVNNSLAGRGMSAKNALRTPTFWIIFISYFLFCFLSAFTQSSVMFFMEYGYALEQAIAFLGVMSGAGVVCKLLMGFLCDRIGPKWCGVIAGACGALGFILQMASGGKSAVVPYVFCVLLTMSFTYLGVLNMPITRDLFGMKNLASILPLVGLPLGLGTAILIPVWGIIYTKLGSYILCCRLCVVFVVISMVLMFVAFLLSKSKSFQAKFEDDSVSK